MYSVNNIELKNLNNFECKILYEETRMTHPLNSILLEDFKQKYDFVADAHEFSYAYDLEIPYMIKGKKQFLPLRGSRPNFHKRYELGNTGTNASLYKYIIKYSNKEVWVSETDANFTDLPSGIKISTAEEDLKVVFCEFQAGGGAGNGSNLVTYGRGGASGAYIVVALELEHPAGQFWKQNSFPILIGNGGVTCNGNNKGGDGGDTGLPWNNGIVEATAYGGNGANEGNGGICRGYAVKNCDIVHLLYSQNGNQPTESTQVQPPIQTDFCAPKGELNQLFYPQRTSIYNGSGQAGGCSVLGNGGEGSRNGIGGSAGINSWGAGGGGGGYKAFNIQDGGNGCGGYVAIYY